MKKMLEEFKAFILRGNVLDLAVGVIVAGAFGKIIPHQRETWVRCKLLGITSWQGRALLVRSVAEMLPSGRTMAAPT